MPQFTIPYASRSSGYPSRISDLIRNQGEIQAQRAARSGDIWSGTLRDIAQGIANIPRMQAETEERKARAEERTAQADERRQRIEQNEAQQKRAESFRTTMGSGNGRDQILSTLQSDPEAYKMASEHFGRMDDARGRFLGTAAAGIRAFKDSPQAVSAVLDDLVEQGYDAQKIDTLRQRLSDPSAISPLVDSFLSQSPDPEHRKLVSPKGDGFTLGKGQVRYDSSGRAIAEGPADDPKPTNLQHVETAQGVRAFNPATGEMGPVIAQGKPPADANNRIWVTRPMPDGTRQTLRVSEGEIKPGDQPASTREQGRKVTSGDSEDLAMIKDSLQDVTVLRNTIGKTGAGSWAATKIPDVVTSVTGLGAESKSRQATIDRVKQVIGKALEGGVLRKEDELKYEKILPKIGDEPTVVKAKLDGLEAAIKRKMRNRLDSLSDAGYDVSGFQKREDSNGKRSLSSDPNAGEPIK